MRQTVFYRATRVLDDLRSVHGLKHEMAKRQMLEPLRLCVRLPLWEYELELVAVDESKRRVRLRAHADPVEPARRRLRAIGFHRDLEALGVKRVDEWLIELQQGLATRAHDVRKGRPSLPRPKAGDAPGDLSRRGELSSVHTDADEVRIAEAADGISAIGFAARPQVTPAETAEHRWAAGLRAFTLQRVEDLLNGVHDI